MLQINTEEKAIVFLENNGDFLELNEELRSNYNVIIKAININRDNILHVPANALLKDYKQTIGIFQLLFKKRTALTPFLHYKNNSIINLWDDYLKNMASEDLNTHMEKKVLFYNKIEQIRKDGDQITTLFNIDDFKKEPELLIRIFDLYIEVKDENILDDKNHFANKLINDCFIEYSKKKWSREDADINKIKDILLGTTNSKKMHFFEPTTMPNTAAQQHTTTTIIKNRNQTSSSKPILSNPTTVRPTVTQSINTTIKTQKTSKRIMPNTDAQQHTTTTKKTNNKFSNSKLVLTILAIIAIASLFLIIIYLSNRKIANQIFDKQNIKNTATKLQNTNISR